MLITNRYKDRDLTLSNEIVSYIQQKGGSAAICVSNVEDDNQKDFALSEIPADTECILVLGGDGTLIRAATKVEALQIPLIGVNLGTLGYLCELEEATVFHAIDCLMQDDCIMEERIVLTGEKIGGNGAHMALNDVVIHWSGDLSMLLLNVYVNGEYLTTYHADGVIVATPTGSTGYNLSTGGPIVDPKARVLLLTPINAHDLNSKSIVFGAEDVVEIKMGSRRFQKDETACVSFDVVIDSIHRQLTAIEKVLNELKSKDSVNYFPLVDTLKLDSVFTITVDSIVPGLYKFGTTIHFDSLQNTQNRRIRSYFLSADGNDTLRVRDLVVDFDTLKRSYNWSQYADSVYNRLVITFLDTMPPAKYIKPVKGKKTPPAKKEKLVKLDEMGGEAWGTYLYRPYVSRETEKRLKQSLRRR